MLPVQPKLPTDPILRAVRIARFWARVEVPHAGATRACWRWRGPVQPNCVASYLWAKDRGTTAARFAWFLVYGEPVPPGMLLRRTCRMPDCIRPDHRRTWSPAEVAGAVRAAVAAGVETQRQIADRLGIPVGSVGRLAMKRAKRRAA